MAKDRSHLAVAVTVGASAAAVFWVAFLAFIFLGPSDAQNGIGVFLSPALALWFGVSAGMLALGWKHLSDEKSVSMVPTPLIVIGLLGVGSIIAFAVGEMYQATHPTVYHAPINVAK